MVTTERVTTESVTIESVTRESKCLITSSSKVSAAGWDRNCSRASGMNMYPSNRVVKFEYRVVREVSRSAY